VRVVTRALFAFGVLITSSALAYPGGTWTHRSSPGFSFWHNFWCDLLSTRALDGRPNLLGSLLARAAFAAFALALVRFWPLAIALSGGAAQRDNPNAATDEPREPGRAARLTGQSGAICLLVVALVPAATSQTLHGVAVLVSAGASVAAAAMLLPGLWRNGERTAVALGTLTLMLAVVCLVQYVYQGVGGHVAHWLAGMQKITTAGLLAFMVHLLQRARVMVTARA